MITVILNISMWVTQSHAVKMPNSQIRKLRDREIPWPNTRQGEI